LHKRTLIMRVSKADGSEVLDLISDVS
jgi:hypothetical protein